MTHEDPDLTAQICDDEASLLAEVRRRLLEVPTLVPPSERDIVAELLRLRDELNAAKDEDQAAMLQQYDQQAALLQQLRDSRDREHVDPASPYFAHLRVEENGKLRDLFLGKATRIDHGLRVVDWRNAPVSRLYYSYQQGDVYEETFGNRRVEGTVEARRTVTIEQGELHRIDAPEGHFLRTPEGWHRSLREAPRLAGGQGLATRVHGTGQGGDRRLGTDAMGRPQRTDKRLPDIAGLIDPDQFDLITRPSTGILVVRGTAGSGKTTVALHRIAYLAFHDVRIDSDRTLFLVFSKALRDYVARVLPALGVVRVVPTTFPQWANAQRRRHFPRLPREQRDDTPAAVLRLKSHPAMLTALARQREDVQGPSTAAQAIDDWASVLTQETLLRSVLDDVAPGAFSEAELRRILAFNRDRHAELVAWWERIEGDDVESPTLDPEDDALLLRAWQLRVGPLRDKGQRPLSLLHVAIDEVQDFTPLEVRVLLDCVDKEGSVTLSGDTQQHVVEHSGFESWSELFAQAGVAATEVETLRVAYRSAEPIVAFATALLGDLREDDMPPLTVRSGPPVEVFRFTDHGAAVAFLSDALRALAHAEPQASVAVLAPDRGIADIYAEGLLRGEVPRCRRVVDAEFSFTAGVEVVEANQIKGLEFDYVVIVEASAQHYPDLPFARRLLHVAATRAMHQLWLISVGTLSPIVREALAQGTAITEA